jgi:putative ABC transport system permease protein
MIKNYLTIAWRSLIKSRSIAVINILGLVVGISSSLFIGLFILDELQFDQHFTFKDRIYRLTSTFVNQGRVLHSAQTTANIGPALVRQFPEIQKATRMFVDEGFIFSNETALKEKILFTDSSFTQLFDLTLLLGNKNNCLTDPSSVIISERIAIKLFGENWIQKKVLGEPIQIDGRIPLSITGVFRDLPRHTHFQSNLISSVPLGFERWLSDQSEVYTYVLLKENSYPDNLSRKLKSISIFLNKTKEIGLTRLDMQAITDIHLFSSLENDDAILGNIKSIYALVLVAVFVLIIVLANFANLFTTSSLNRLKEVGVRKTIGALSIQVRNQFLLETFLITTVSLGISLLMVITFLPTFNELTGSNLSLKGLMSWKIVLFVTLLTVAISFLAGFYPSIYLSGRKAIDALKAMRNKGTSTTEWRKGLIIVQFSVSCILIVLSIVAYKQVALINNTRLGFDKENTIALANPYMLGSIQNFIGFKNKLLRVPGVEHVSITGYTPFQTRWGGLKITFPDRNANSLYAQQARWLMVDESFIETMGLTLITGRNFQENHENDSDAVIINETAARQFKLTADGRSPIGFELSRESERQAGNENYKVIGVVKDFNFGSLHEPIKPVVIKAGYHRAEMALRLSSKYSNTETINKIESVWKKHLPKIPFEYYFIKDRFDQLHKSDTTASTLFSILCFVTVILSALGLFSIVTYTISNRTKEIGIRKLLGASRRSIVFLLANQFIKLVIVSCALALPIAWIFSNKWLEDFAYRTEVSWWIYAITGFILLLVTILTLGYQTLKAASTNPVDNLRYE